MQNFPPPAAWSAPRLRVSPEATAHLEAECGDRSCSIDPGPEFSPGRGTCGSSLGTESTRPAGVCNGFPRRSRRLSAARGAVGPPLSDGCAQPPHPHSAVLGFCAQAVLPPQPASITTPYHLLVRFTLRPPRPAASTVMRQSPARAETQPASQRWRMNGWGCGKPGGSRGEARGEARRKPGGSREEAGGKLG